MLSYVFTPKTQTANRQLTYLARAEIINDIIVSHPNATLSYHFFRHSQMESISDVWRHLVHQSLSQPTVVSQIAVRLHQKSKTNKKQLLPKDLVSILCDIASASSRTYIVLDGLDEFPHFAKLLKHIPELINVKAHLLVSSRELPSIRALLGNAKILDVKTNPADIGTYVEWRLKEDSGLEDAFLNPDLKREICDRLVKHVDGSYVFSSFTVRPCTLRMSSMLITIRSDFF